MKKNAVYCLILFSAFFAVLAALLFAGERDAAELRDSVLRLHIVANSDVERDQQIKMLVRDGLADMCADLFYGQTDKAAVMDIARENADAIAARATETISAAGGGYTAKTVVRKRFFPTRTYDGVSLPAGVYDTVDVELGKAEGKNFWCVMFPAICVGASSARTSREKLGAVVSDGALELASSEDGVRLRFAAVELFEKLIKILRR